MAVEMKKIKNCITCLKSTQGQNFLGCKNPGELWAASSGNRDLWLEKCIYSLLLEILPDSYFIFIPVATLMAGWSR